MLKKVFASLKFCVKIYSMGQRMNHHFRIVVMFLKCTFVSQWSIQAFEYETGSVSILYFSKVFMINWGKNT